MNKVTGTTFPQCPQLSECPFPTEINANLRKHTSTCFLQMIVILVKMDHEAKMKGAGESETLKKKTEKSLRNQVSEKH